MDRRAWGELPASVRRAVESRCGPVIEAVPASAGINNAFAATLHPAHGGPAMFCKGIPGDADPWTRAMFEREAGIAGYLPAGLAPRLRWQIHTGGWWLLGFEHITGRPADFSPGSPDLPRITAALRELAAHLTPCPAGGQQQFGQRLADMRIWGTYRCDPPSGLDPWAADHLDLLSYWESVAPVFVAGDTLLHTDLNSHNWILGPELARIVDWSWTAIGAAWIEAEFLAPRLLAAGHGCRDAERWVDSVVAGLAPGTDARTAFAVAVAGIWTHRALKGGFKPELAAGARNWARHRLALVDAGSLAR